MITSNPARVRGARTVAALGTVALAVGALAGCSTEAAPEADPAFAAESSESPLAAEVAQLMEPADELPIPAEPVSDASGLAGKTVYYIPISQQAPKFATVGKALTEALAAVGAEVQVCDGKGTPTDISACATQATQTGAAAIVTDAIYYNMAANAFDDAQAAGVPVLNMNQYPADGHPASQTLGYIVSSDGRIQPAIAKWITVDSEGTGNILVNSSVDGPAPGISLAEGERVLEAECSDCVLTVNEITASNFAQIPSSTSSALLKNPNIDYVLSQYDQYLQVTQTGVQQANALDRVKGITGSAQLSALQQLRAEDFLYAAVGDSSAFNGWIAADAVLRMVAGDELPEYTVPIRLFTRDNIGDIELTEAAQDSGEWYGPTDFPEKFKKLWGVA